MTPPTGLTRCCGVRPKACAPALGEPPMTPPIGAEVEGAVDDRMFVNGLLPLMTLGLPGRTDPVCVPGTPCPGTRPMTVGTGGSTAGCIGPGGRAEFGAAIVKGPGLGLPPASVGPGP